jgi:hypothetical protein
MFLSKNRYAKKPDFLEKPLFLGCSSKQFDLLYNATIITKTKNSVNLSVNLKLALTQN